MNNYEEISKMLGVELKEEFKVKWKSGVRFTNSKYCFTKDGLNEVGTIWYAHGILGDILSGKAEIVKSPWKPKNGEQYWHYSEAWNEGISCEWEGGFNDLLLWKAGNCFRTEEDAKAKGKKIMEQIRKEFEES